MKILEDQDENPLEQLTIWEKQVRSGIHKWDLRQGKSKFQKYVNLLQKIHRPLQEISGYIQFAEFCLKQGDDQTAQELFQHSQDLISNYRNLTAMKNGYN